MLTIRKAQIDRLEREHWQAFVGHVVAAIEAHYTADYLEQGPPTVRQNVERALKEAIDYGIVTEADLFRFVNLSYRFGLGFADRPEHVWVKAIFTCDMAPARKLDRVMTLLATRPPSAERG
jgi:hypothetical protein